MKLEEKRKEGEEKVNATDHIIISVDNYNINLLLTRFLIEYVIQLVTLW